MASNDVTESGGASSSSGKKSKRSAARTDSKIGPGTERVAVERGDDVVGRSNLPPPKKDVYLPGKALEEGEILVCDESVYKIFHKFRTGSPCLSFDVIHDNLGERRSSYPMTAYLVAGTQAEQPFDNKLLILKLMNMHRTKESKKREEKEKRKTERDGELGEHAEDMESDEDSGESESETEDEEDAELAVVSIKQRACINRVRSTVINERAYTAAWSECGKVFIHDITECLKKLSDVQTTDDHSETTEDSKAAYTFSGHLSEGFGIDWSPTVPGNLLTGDCKNRIHLWKRTNAAWNVDQRPFTAHEGSVEDIQWSPSESTVFASCSVDKSIRIWDIRAPPHKACMITVSSAHSSDVNVISWNKTDPFIVSGGDDGIVNVWDLRELQSKAPVPVAIFKHHSKPVTTVEWNPLDSSVFATGGEDDQIAFWDIAVEPDDDVGDGDAAMEDEVPPQLLFIHQGQKDVKELHWHSQIPGMCISTALSGFNVFQTISV